MLRIACKPIAAALLGDYLDFFDHRAFTDNPRWASCYCNFPLHDPARKAWRLHTAPENRAAVAQCIASNKASGFLAYVGDAVVGWCNAAPWSHYPMLRDSPQPEAATLGMIYCFIVEAKWRGRGVARALLGAACEGLRASGLAAVQATPLKSSHDAGANHLGPLGMYLSAGFQVVCDGEDGTVVVRKSLLGTAPITAQV